mgnify:CR=1 FL=1
MNTSIHANRHISVFLDNNMFLKSLEHPLQKKLKKRIKIKIAKQEKSYQWILWTLFSIVAITTITAITVMPI